MTSHKIRTNPDCSTNGIDPMFPHRYDCHLLFETLLWGLREGRTQRELARDGNVALGTVAFLMNASDSVKPRSLSGSAPSGDSPEQVSKERRVKRSTALHFLRQGLRLDRDMLDALLWLYEGKPLEPGEIEAYNLPSATHDGRQSGLRQVVLDQLEVLINHQFPSSGELHPQVTIFSADVEGRLRGSQTVEEVEKLPGQRLFVAGTPSHLVHPSEFLADERSSDQVLRDHLGQASRDVRTTFRRLAIMKEQVKTFGSRNMHSRTAIRAYLTADTPDRERTRTDARHHVENLIRILRDQDCYPYYWVGLVEDTPALELDMKAMQKVVMRGARPGGYRRPEWGWHYILWQDRASVLKLYLDFESAWTKTLTQEEAARGDINPARKRVADQLQELVDQAG